MTGIGKFVDEVLKQTRPVLGSLSVSWGLLVVDHASGATITLRAVSGKNVAEYTWQPSVIEADVGRARAVHNGVKAVKAAVEGFSPLAVETLG